MTVSHIQRTITSSIYAALRGARPLPMFAKNSPVGLFESSCKSLQPVFQRSSALTRKSLSTFIRPRGTTAFRVCSYSTRTRHQPPPTSRLDRANTDMLYYTTAILVATLGLSYAAVPVYRMFCAATGMGGAPMVGETKFAPERLVPQKNHRRIRVTFNADTSTSLRWSFQPQQRHVHVLPGETALAFYTAKNNSEEDVIGIATYNVTPSKVAPHFNKIQCFCFEEQKLLAGEQVDMPIFFFLDPEFVDDPNMADVETVVLSYTFFKARGMPFEHQPGVAEQKKLNEQD